ncbi:hypothetical protein L486_02171 [Kwoniella mangroviensis CBS 10435]|uniref:Uncharacterized protein n=1 Tax=Kwoniella mangroviensis CBS 10435 TaxID=1331196 RepID=A0A1B9IVR3_9TREE|nr:hypothetical protein L486_02171 [Kwoniella mangroviensis CBS 10435]
MPDTPYHLYRLGKIGLQSKEGTIFRVSIASLAEIRQRRRRAQWALSLWAGERKDVGIARLALGQMDIQNALRPGLPRKLDPSQWDNFIFYDVVTNHLLCMWQLTISHLTIQSPGKELPHEYGYEGKINSGLKGFKIWMDWKRVADAGNPKPM